MGETFFHYLGKATPAGKDSGKSGIKEKRRLYVLDDWLIDIFQGLHRLKKPEPCRGSITVARCTPPNSLNPCRGFIMDAGGWVLGSKFRVVRFITS